MGFAGIAGLLAVAAECRSDGQKAEPVAVFVGTGMCTGSAVPGNFGHRRSTRDAGRDGRVGVEQEDRAAGWKRKGFDLGQPAARASSVGGECDVAGCSGSSTA